MGQKIIVSALFEKHFQTLTRRNEATRVIIVPVKFETNVHENYKTFIANIAYLMKKIFPHKKNIYI